MISIFIYCFLFSKNGGHGFEGHTEVDILTVADAALNAAAVVGRRCDTSILIAEYVVHGLAAHGGAVESIAILKAFDGIDTQHGLT